MSPEVAEAARREEVERVPAKVFAVDPSNRVHVCAGPGSRFSRFTFCGTRIRARWHIYDMSGWDSEWSLCPECEAWTVDLDWLSHLTP